jgi:hypothetical protein
MPSQESTVDQLRRLVALATSAGLYDAADWLSVRIPAEFTVPVEKAPQPVDERRQAYWYCGNGHRFLYGNEEWHHEQGQGYWLEGLPNLPIPAYCLAEFGGEPCMDSTSLVPDL